MESTTLPSTKSIKTLSEVMEDILFSSDGADVTFDVHGKKLHAHKLILAHRSPVLKAMIEGPMAPADQSHEITDPEITYEDFFNFMVFLYTDNCIIEKTNLKALLHLGNFYDVPYLHEKCGDAIDAFELYCSDLYQYTEMVFQYAPASPSLLERCFKWLSSCNQCDGPFAYLLDEEGRELKWISSDLVMEIVKKCPRGKHSFTEDKIFKKVFQWANHECVQQNLPPTSEAIREIILPFMDHFKPESFSLLTLATTVKKYELLSPEKLNDCFAEIIVKEAENDGHRHRHDRNTAAAAAGSDSSHGRIPKKVDFCSNKGRYDRSFQHRYREDSERPPFRIRFAKEDERVPNPAHENVGCHIGAFEAVRNENQESDAAWR